MSLTDLRSGLFPLLGFLLNCHAKSAKGMAVGLQHFPEMMLRYQFRPDNAVVQCASGTIRLSNRSGQRLLHTLIQVVKEIPQDFRFAIMPKSSLWRQFHCFLLVDFCYVNLISIQVGADFTINPKISTADGCCR